MPRRLLALPTVALAVVLAVAGCVEQPQEANDNGPEPDPSQPAGVVRTPVPSEAPSTVPLPGESNSPDVSEEQSAEASPGAS